MLDHLWITETMSQEGPQDITSLTFTPKVSLENPRREEDEK